MSVESASRSCLICSARTTNTHLGVDACRACAAFFKRTATKKKQYICRQGSHHCVVSRSERFQCRSCRYEKCLRFGMRLEDTPHDESKLESMAPSTSAEVQLSAILPEPSPSAFTLVNPLPTQTTTSPTPSSDSPWSGGSRREDGGIPFLKKLELHYREMCAVRKSHELATLQPPLMAPKSLLGDVMPTRFLATYYRMDTLHRIAVIALFDFADSAFDGFRELDLEEKWAIIRACHFSIILCDGFYRTEQLCPDDDDILVISFTNYFKLSDMSSFFVDAPSQERMKDANEVLQRATTALSRMVRPLLKRAAMDETEQIALLSLAFWCNNAVASMSERVRAMAERHRNAIFHELHVYYQQSGREEYAARLGRIMFQLSTYQESTLRMMEEFEIYRLLDVFNDDTFVYRFCNKKC